MRWDILFGVDVAVKLRVANKFGRQLKADERPGGTVETCVVDAAHGISATGFIYCYWVFNEWMSVQLFLNWINLLLWYCLFQKIAWTNSKPKVPLEHCFLVTFRIIFRPWFTWRFNSPHNVKTRHNNKCTVPGIAIAGLRPTQYKSKPVSIRPVCTLV